MEWLQFTLLLLALGGMSSFGYLKARRDAIHIINELKSDLPAALGILGKSLAHSKNSMVAAAASADSRLDKAVSERLLSDFLNSQSPWAKLLLEYGKETVPFLQDHPEAIETLLPLIQKYLGAMGAKDLSSNEPFLGLKK